jgi:hypothetical protein
MLIAEFEQLGANIVKDTIRLTIRPMEDETDEAARND